MPFSRALVLPTLLLLYAFPQTAAALSLKYQLSPISNEEITYYYEEPVGQGDSLYGYYDPARPVSGFIILDLTEYDPVYNADGYFGPDVKRYSFTNGLWTFNHHNSYVDLGYSTKFGPRFALEKFDFFFDRVVPVGDWSTLYVDNDQVESEFRYLYLPEEPDACYDGEFGLCSEYARGISRRSVTWTVSAVPAPGAIGTLASGLLLMGAMAGLRNRKRFRRG